MEKIPFIGAGTHLYRFLNPAARHFWPSIGELLSNQTLFLNSRTNFNDPYDSRPIVDNDLSTAAIRTYCQQAIQNPINPRRSITSVARILELKSSGRTHLNKKMIENIKIEMRQATDDFLDRAGLVSFSLTAENPLLWGHYAELFMGICAIFRRGISASSALSMCARVSYVNKRPRLPVSLFHQMAATRMLGGAYDDLANEIFFLSFLHKSVYWGYEQEARIFYPFSALEKLPFGPDELIGFILGPKSPPEFERRMRMEIATRRPSVVLHKSSLSETDFRIIIPHEFSAQHARV